MATLQDLTDAVSGNTTATNAVKDSVTALSADFTAAINHLEELIAAGSPDLQPAVDALKSSTQVLNDQKTIVDGLDAVAKVESTK